MLCKYENTGAPTVAHFIIALALGLLGTWGMFESGPRSLGPNVGCWLVISGVALYVILVLIEAALRSGAPAGGCQFIPFPSRHWSLPIVPFLLAASIASFAGIYIHSGSVFRNGDDPADAKTSPVRVIVCNTVCSVKDTASKRPSPPVPLHTASAAFYFSTVTITTVGFGDFVPTGHAQLYVCAELLIGALLLIVTFPLVVGRIATWKTDDETVVKVRKALGAPALRVPLGQRGRIADTLVTATMFGGCHGDKTKRDKFLTDCVAAVKALYADEDPGRLAQDWSAVTSSLILALDNETLTV
jgi:hypothetical protein